MKLTALGWTTVVYLAALSLGCVLALEAFPKVRGGNVAAGGAAAALMIVYAAAAILGWAVAVSLAVFRTNQLGVFGWGTAFFSVLVAAILFQLAVHLDGFNGGAAVGILVPSVALFAGVLLAKADRTTVIASSVVFALGAAFALGAFAVQARRSASTAASSRLQGEMSNLDLAALTARFQESRFDPAAHDELGYRLAAQAGRLDVLLWFVSQRPDARGACAGLLSAALSDRPERLEAAWKLHQERSRLLGRDEAAGLSECAHAAVALGLSQERPALQTQLLALSPDLRRTQAYGVCGLSFLEDARALLRFVPASGLLARNGKLDARTLWSLEQQSSGQLLYGGSGRPGAGWQLAPKRRRESLFTEADLLTRAAWRRDYAEVKRLLDSGAPASYTNVCGETPLTAAIQGGDWEMQEDHVTLLSLSDLLLRHGADPNARGAFPVCSDAAGEQETRTPLHYAILGISFDRKKQLATIEALLKAGADPNRKDSRGERPLKTALTSFFDSGVANPIAAVLRRYGGK